MEKKQNSFQDFEARCQKTFTPLFMVMQEYKWSAGDSFDLFRILGLILYDLKLESSYEIDEYLDLISTALQHLVTLPEFMVAYIEMSERMNQRANQQNGLDVSAVQNNVTSLGFSYAQDINNNGCSLQIALGDVSSELPNVRLLYVLTPKYGYFEEFSGEKRVKTEKIYSSGDDDSIPEDAGIMVYKWTTYVLEFLYLALRIQDGLGQKQE